MRLTLFFNSILLNFGSVGLRDIVSGRPFVSQPSVEYNHYTVYHYVEWCYSVNHCFGCRYAGLLYEECHYAVYYYTEMP
jgi:hypothetical protein